MIDIRLQKIYDAGCKLFINMGYARTQISHIAKEAGISVGAVYTLFSGKREILNFILKCTLDPSFIEREFQLPIREREFAHLQEEVKQAFETNAERFASHLLFRERYPFEAMLSDAFDAVSNYAAGCLLFEKNPDDCGPAAEDYRRYRQAFFRDMQEYLKGYLERGELRAVPHPELSVVMIIETIAWWAMHIRYDTYDVREDIPISTAKEVCMDALLHAFQKS